MKLKKIYHLEDYQYQKTKVLTKNLIGKELNEITCPMAALLSPRVRAPMAYV